MDPEHQPPDVSIGYYRGPVARIIEAIDRAGFVDAAMHLDAAGEELEAFVIERGANHVLASRENRRARGRVVLGIEWGGGQHALPIEGSNLTDLVKLSEHHPDPAIAMELDVFDALGVLLSAPDAGDNDIFISPRVSNEARVAIVRHLGPSLAPAA